MILDASPKLAVVQSAAVHKKAANGWWVVLAKHASFTGSVVSRTLATASIQCL